MTVCVVYAVETDADPPVIRREPSAGLVVKGRSTELSCEADGNPPIKYEWFKVSITHLMSVSTPEYFRMVDSVFSRFILRCLFLASTTSPTKVW